MSWNGEMARPHGKRPSLWPEVLHRKIEAVRLVHVAGRVQRPGVNVINGMRVERVRMLALHDVVETGRIR